MSVDSFFTNFNPLIRGILNSPLHWLLSAGLMVITVTGRKTGRSYSFPVGYQRDREGITVIISEAKSKSWWRNYREPGPVELRVRGRDLRGSATLVAPGSPEFRENAALTLRRMPWLAKVFRVDDFDRKAGLSEEQHKRLAEEIACVRITLEESPL